MAGGLLTIASSLQCPHGGTVVIVPSNPLVRVGNIPLATAADTFTVIGCPFQLPTVPPIPSPCITVQWLVTDPTQKAGNAPTLSLSSQGICLSAAQIPQGPVVISSTQPQVATG